MERWRKVLEFPRYSISDLGRVRNDQTKRVLTLTRNQRGIINVSLVDSDGRQHRRSVAKLVLSHFGDLDSSGSDSVVYLDGDKTNCCIRNLKAGTRSEAYQRNRGRFNYYTRGEG